MSSQSKTVRLDSEKMDKAKNIAAESYLSFNSLVEMLVDSVIRYHDEHGRLPTPIHIVPVHEYEHFEVFRAKETAKLNVAMVEANYRKAETEPEGGETPKKKPAKKTYRKAGAKTAKPSGNSGKQAS